MATNVSENSWEGVAKLAEEAGAKYPELVAAQWALESGWGKHAPYHNYFGLKASDGKSEYKKFESLKHCVQYLVRLWYKDYKQYKGVNNAPNAEAAAKALKDQGYAEDPDYTIKLIKLLRGHAKAPSKPIKPAVKNLFFIQALQDTFLKKYPKQSEELTEDKKVFVPKGKVYPVYQAKEQPSDAHIWLELGHEAGEWYIWQPHWSYVAQQKLIAPIAQPNWTKFNSLVTPNLTVGEVLQWDSRRTPRAGSSDERRILQTAQEFQKIRNAWKRGIGVTSFYRPEPINRQIGGVPGSRHVSGEAMDIYPVSVGMDAFYQWIRQRWTGGLGDGRTRGFIHLDRRNNGYFVPGAGVRPYVEFNY